MRKDELKSGDYCPDCVEAENGNAEPGTEITDECCCCCCSCSDSSSEAESSNASASPEGNRNTSSLEQQKKDFMSNFTILRANREPMSVQHVLQFVEGLTHSSDFLRRYNLQEDFCMECLLSEPSCTCCASGISQLNLNDRSCDSCDECNSNEDSRQRYPSPECPDCAASPKAPSSARQRTINRRERRRRRRQRNIPHNLPRVTTQGFRLNRGATADNLRYQNSSDRDCLHGRADRSIPESRQNQNEANHLIDNCEECAREEVSRQGNRHELRGFSEALHENSNEDFKCCEECARENSPSISCTSSCCGDCESKSHRIGNSSRHTSNDREQVESCCDCCCNPSNEIPKDKSKRRKVSDRPECDQSETCSLESSHGKDQTEECTCEECQSKSECSDTSCDECSNRKSKGKKGK